jgi:hypothetical protein
MLTIFDEIRKERERESTTSTLVCTREQHRFQQLAESKCMYIALDSIMVLEVYRSQSRSIHLYLSRMLLPREVNNMVRLNISLIKKRDFWMIYFLIIFVGKPHLDHGPNFLQTIHFHLQLSCSVQQMCHNSSWDSLLWLN